MPDEITIPEGGQAQTTEPEVTPEPTGLPSEQPTGNEYDGFVLNDETKAKFKDGKLNGRFGSIEDVLAKLKEAEDFKANSIREQKNTEGQQQQQQEQTQAQDAVIQTVLPEFKANGYKLTPEMEETLTAGITDPTKKQLAIYKFRDDARNIADKVNAVHSVVGGKEAYEAMQVWATDNLSEEHKAVFTKDVEVGGSASVIAVEWLNSKYQKALNEGHVPERISGQPHNTGIRPYVDRRELYKDKDYIESPAGRRDSAAKKMYRARLKATPDSVVFGS